MWCNVEDIESVSYTHLAAENKEDFELYALVPPTATVVFETDDMCALVQEINELNCSRDNNYLYISKIFSYLKLHLYTLLEDTPHGLSRQMSKMLLSFHEPANDRNQVLYCALGLSLIHISFLGEITNFIHRGHIAIH